MLRPLSCLPAGCVPYRYPATIPVKLPDAMERSLDGLALSLSDDA
jgi:hypothetical protein